MHQNQGPEKFKHFSGLYSEWNSWDAGSVNLLTESALIATYFTDDENTAGL